MGLSPFKCSGSSLDSQQIITNKAKVEANNCLCKKLPNPDPKRFMIEKYKEIGSWLIVQLVYHDCTNYEGRKILVYRNASLDDLIIQSGTVGVDPHFAENKKFLSPFARFEPTDEGWEVAEDFVNYMWKYG